MLLRILRRELTQLSVSKYHCGSGVCMVLFFACMCSHELKAYLPHSSRNWREKKTHTEWLTVATGFFFCLLTRSLIVVWLFFRFIYYIYIFLQCLCCDGAYTIIISIWVHDKNDESLFYYWRQLCTNSQWAQWIATTYTMQYVYRIEKKIPDNILPYAKDF